MLTTPVVAIGSVDPIITPLLTTSMLSATIVSTPMVVMLASNDKIIHILVCCFWVSTTVASDIIGGVVLTQY
jgi:predicted membrane protein